jgi:hypothetical protein
VGVELEKPLGRCRGDFKGVEYFSCDKRFGMFVKPEQVRCLATLRAPVSEFASAATAAGLFSSTLASLLRPPPPSLLVLSLVPLPPSCLHCTLHAVICLCGVLCRPCWAPWLPLFALELLQDTALPPPPLPSLP